MSLEATENGVDLIRWTFTVAPEHRQAIESHLEDLGADVWVREDVKFQVTWEEPDADLDEVVEALWEIQGSSFDITQEEFHRMGLHLLQSESEETAQAA